MGYGEHGVGYGVHTGVSFPRRMLRRVDLPTPLGPTIATGRGEREKKGVM